jgi:predicted alpha/beta superfamily hydrolase
LRSLAAFVLLAAAALAQSIDLGSKVLHETRSIRIAKPADYDTKADRYPVLFLLDAEEHFDYTAPLVRYLADHDRMPPMLVVGIQSGTRAQRTRDLTPPSDSEMDNRFSPGNGGAPAFLSFLADELIPYVERNYRTRPYRLLIGHSYGGLFAAYTMLNRPPLIQGFIVVDPTLTWNNQALAAQAETFVAHARELPVDLHLSAAYPEGGDIARFAKALQARALAAFRFRFDLMPEETHGSIPPRAILDGLAFVFDGWYCTAPLSLFDQGGIEAVHRHFRDGGRRYGGYDRATSPFDVSMIVAGLIRDGRLEEAGAVLLHDPKAYPPPWNQLDALARNYESRGDKPQAIRYYRLSLERNPANDLARRKLAELGPISPAAGK